MAFDTAHAPLMPPSGDPLGPHVASSCFEFLLIELVPLAYRMAEQQAARDAEADAAAEQWMMLADRGGGQQKGGAKSVQSGGGASGAATSSGPAGGSVGGTVSKPANTVVSTVTGTMGTGIGIGGIGGSVDGMDEEETREAVFWRLDSLGYRVGLGLVDRFARDKPRFTDTLDVIKFLCKDLWTLVFRKQIDNLKTNHRGIYVLTDNSFRPLSKMSLERGRDAQTMMAQAQPFLYFPAGVIRGALASMGIVAVVQAESSELPGASFQIRTQAAR